MSELSTKINETALKEMMVSIRRNAKDSACIDNFENLLREIENPEFVNITVNSMTNFLSEWFEVLGAVILVPQKKYRSRMLTTQFIEPMRFFNRVRKMADEQMLVRSTLEWMFGEQYSNATKTTSRKPCMASVEEMSDILNDLLKPTDIDGKPIQLSWQELRAIPEDELSEMIPTTEALKELARKEMLVWNYIPGVIKAIIQTKRREMNMDNNSKKF